MSKLPTTRGEQPGAGKLPAPAGRLRVAFVAGTLGQGGAEKQLVYMARALRDAGADVRVYSLTRGEFYEPALKALGIEPIWIGKQHNVVLRMLALAAALRQFKPHVLQATQFFPSLYVSIAGRLRSTVPIGSLRSDGYLEVQGSKYWRWLLRLPPSFIVNSYAAKHNAEALGVKAGKLFVLHNVIDLRDFDTKASQARPEPGPEGQLVVATAGTLIAHKRQDLFLQALARARSDVKELKGLLIGDGPEQDRLRSLASDLGLLPEGLQFLGRRDDVPALLSSADIYLLTSHHEGFPNVLLEAMAARLPAVTTPAGDSAMVVQNEVTGYVVPFDDVEAMARSMVLLARSPDLRRDLGEAGRRRVEQDYSPEGLAGRLLTIYENIARQQNNPSLLRVLSQYQTVMTFTPAACRPTSQLT